VNKEDRWDPWWHVYRRKVIRWEFDDVALGADRRHYREKFGISLREFARAMKVSASYISDLELGRRKWNHQLVFIFEDTLLEIIKRSAEK